MSTESLPPRSPMLAGNGGLIAAVVQARVDVPSNWEAKAKALNSSRLTVELAPGGFVISWPRYLVSARTRT